MPSLAMEALRRAWLAQAELCLFIVLCAVFTLSTYRIYCTLDAGGVVPSLAMEAHRAAIDRVVDEALARAGMSPSQLDAVSVTVGPGLALCLRVGVAKAMSLSAQHQLPLVRVHHMEAHALVARLAAAAAAAGAGSQQQGQQGQQGQGQQGQGQQGQHVPVSSTEQQQQGQGQEQHVPAPPTGQQVGQQGHPPAGEGGLGERLPFPFLCLLVSGGCRSCSSCAMLCTCCSASQCLSVHLQMGLLGLCWRARLAR